MNASMTPVQKIDRRVFAHCAVAAPYTECVGLWESGTQSGNQNREARKKGRSFDLTIDYLARPAGFESTTPWFLVLK